MTSGDGFGLSFPGWTPGQKQWRKVVETLATKSPDGKVYAGILAKDAVGRKSEGAVISFSIGPGGS